MAVLVAPYHEVTSQESILATNQSSVFGRFKMYNQQALMWLKTCNTLPISHTDTA